MAVCQAEPFQYSPWLRCNVNVVLLPFRPTPPVLSATLPLKVVGGCGGLEEVPAGRRRHRRGAGHGVVQREGDGTAEERVARLVGGRRLNGVRGVELHRPSWATSRLLVQVADVLPMVATFAAARGTAPSLPGRAVPILPVAALERERGAVGIYADAPRVVRNAAAEGRRCGGGGKREAGRGGRHRGGNRRRVIKREADGAASESVASHVGSRCLNRVAAIGLGRPDWQRDVAGPGCRRAADGAKVCRGQVDGGRCKGRAVPVVAAGVLQRERGAVGIQAGAAEPAIVGHTAGEARRHRGGLEEVPARWRRHRGEDGPVLSSVKLAALPVKESPARSVAVAWIV